jgi:exopolysaccharide production protein ExoQ
LCMIFGLFFLWNLLVTRRIDGRRVRQQEVVLSVGFLCMIAWLLTISDSKTSLAAFVVGAAIMLVLSLRIVNWRYVGVYVIVAVLVAIVAEVTFDVYANVIELLGRDPTLTDRTAIWQEVLALQDRPIHGFGFESFWLDPRLESVFAKNLFPRINQAHNGYIEAYLNFGAIGVFLLLALMISTFHKISGQLLTDFEFARLRLGFLFAFILYNYSESTLFGLHPLWTIFMIIAIDYPKVGPSKTKRRQTTRLGPLPQHASLQERPRHVVVDSAASMGASRKQSAREAGGYDS